MAIESLNNVLGKVKYRDKPRWLRRMINMAYYNEDMPLINRHGIDYVSMDDCKFVAEGPLDTFGHAGRDAWFSSLRKDDIFVDLGACIGSVAIPTAKRCKWVHAIEPLWGDILNKNIELNKLSNVTVWAMGICEGTSSGEVSYGKRRKIVAMVSWPLLKEAIGHIDFIKVDIEGFEWQNLHVEDLVDIRDIRIEFHIRRGREREDRRTLQAWQQRLQKSHNVEAEIRQGHLTNIIFSDVVYVKAEMR